MALVPRAEVALIVATIGFEQGHLTHHAMVALVIMTLVTSLLASFSIPIVANKLKKEHHVT